MNHGKNNLEKELNRLGRALAGSSDLSERVLEEIEHTPVPHCGANRWRTIMSKTYTKYAAAAAVLLVGVLGLALINSSATLVWADVVQAMENVTLTHMHSVDPVQGQMDWWIALDKHRLLMLQKNKEGDIRTAQILDGASNTLQSYVVSDETVVVNTLSPEMCQAVPQGDLLEYLMTIFSVASPQVSRSDWQRTSQGNGQATFTLDLATAQDPNFVIIITADERTHLPSSIQDRTGRLKLDIEYPPSIPLTFSDLGLKVAHVKDLSIDPGVNEVWTHYANRREVIKNYRLLIWQLSPNTYPQARVTCSGRKCRIDMFVPRVKQLPTERTWEEDFEDAWQHLVSADLLTSLLVHKGRWAQIRWKRTSAGVALFEASSEYTDNPNPNITRYRLEDLAWPKIPGWEASPGCLPDDPQGEGLVGLWVQTGLDKTRQLDRYWLDPDRDFICVRHEHYQRISERELDPDFQPRESLSPLSELPESEGGYGEYDQVTEVTAWNRTAQGQIYPQKIESTMTYVADGRRYRFPTETIFMLLDTGPVDEDGLEWPAKAPLPK